MAPKKKEATEGSTTLLKGFEDRETKLIAAAFLSSIAPDKVRHTGHQCSVSVSS